jgi:hypothetical protein
MCFPLLHPFGLTAGSLYGVSHVHKSTCCFSDGLLDFVDFGKICCALFRNDKGIVYSCSDENQREMFNIFDQNKVRG